ncbi:MAG: IS91 family transposase [Desulfobacterales bacterium]|nr:IS91 family transposase [Desulfobacterales bacterium]
MRPPLGLYGSEYRARYNTPSRKRQAFNAILNCRKGGFGFHVDVCDTCGHQEILNNSCRDRHCPKCSGMKRRQWVKSRLADILPIPYYHVVFTLPHTFNPLVMWNARLIYELLMGLAAETLQQLAGDSKYLGAKIGFYGVLHTWGQRLWLHPHVHFIVTGGGLSESNHWVRLKYRDKFLFPVEVLSHVFRGKFIEAIKKAHQADTLNFPPDMRELENFDAFDKWLFHAVPTRWVVFAKSPLKGPEKVVKYLSLYTNRTAISNYRLIKIKDDRVYFHDKQYEDKGKKVVFKETSLEALVFINRFLIHVLPENFHRIRYYGLFANGQCKKNIQLIRELLASSEELPQEKANTEDMLWQPLCPRCKSGKMITAYTVYPHGATVINLAAYRRLRYNGGFDSS